MPSEQETLSTGKGVPMPTGENKSDSVAKKLAIAQLGLALFTGGGSWVVGAILLAEVLFPDATGTSRVITDSPAVSSTALVVGGFLVTLPAALYMISPERYLAFRRWEKGGYGHHPPTDGASGEEQQQPDRTQRQGDGRVE